MIHLAHPRKALFGAFSIGLKLYLITFLVIACAPRRPPVTVTEARSMETRIISSDYDQVLKATINVLQDLRYTIDVIESDVGLIVASRQTEGEETALTKEPAQIEQVPTWQKVLGVTIILAIIGGIIWLVTRGGESDGSESRDRGDRHVYHHYDDDQGPAVYEYKVTVNLESIGPAETSIRVSAAGARMRGDSIEQAGAIEDPEFFQRFFASLDKALFLE